MRQNVKVVASERFAPPYAEVPCDCIWDLIKYLAYRQVNVNYDFDLDAAHFTVTFPAHSSCSAQELLDHWAQGAGEYAEAV